MQYNNRYPTDNYPKTFGEAVRKIIGSACLAGIIGIIAYMSILFIYRSVGNPTVIGYTTTVMEFNSDGEAVSEKQAKPYYFLENEKVVVPENTNKVYYNPIYGKDAFPEVLTQILLAIVSSIMIYNRAWGYGSHSNNSDKIANKRHNPFLGVLLALASSGFYFVSYLIMIISKLGLNIPAAMSFFGLTNASYLPLFNAFVENEIGTVGLVGVLNNSPADFMWIGMLFMLIPLAIKIIVCFVAYELGYRNISIKNKIIYKD